MNTSERIGLYWRFSAIHNRRIYGADVCFYLSPNVATFVHSKIGEIEMKRKQGLLFAQCERAEALGFRTEHGKQIGVEQRRKIIRVLERGRAG